MYKNTGFVEVSDHFTASVVVPYMIGGIDKSGQNDSSGVVSLWSEIKTLNEN